LRIALCGKLYYKISIIIIHNNPKFLTREFDKRLGFVYVLVGRAWSNKSKEELPRGTIGVDRLQVNGIYSMCKII
jgi:hypothetical protein